MSTASNRGGSICNTVSNCGDRCCIVGRDTLQGTIVGCCVGAVGGKTSHEARVGAARHVDKALLLEFFSVVGLATSLVSRQNVVLDCPLVLSKVVS